MPLTITERTIRNLASAPGAYLKGNLYFRNDRVRNLHFDEQYRSLRADVHGRDIYNVAVVFGANGEVTYTYCSCPAFSNYSGACKHIIAALKA
ncbi:MAG: SWIM zinc finger family protein, partial [Bacillota bacterium]